MRRGMYHAVRKMNKGGKMMGRPEDEGIKVFCGEENEERKG